MTIVPAPCQQNTGTKARGAAWDGCGACSPSAAPALRKTDFVTSTDGPTLATSPAGRSRRRSSSRRAVVRGAWMGAATAAAAPLPRCARSAAARAQCLLAWSPVRRDLLLTRWRGPSAWGA
eukprot:358760-Chlamydomonas_euryale.AAC.6